MCGNKDALPKIEFYTRPGCHLCQEALFVLKALQGEFSFRIHVIDISSSEELTRLYGNDIPVAVLDGRKILKHRADERKLRRMLGD